MSEKEKKQSADIAQMLGSMNDNQRKAITSYAKGLTDGYKIGVEDKEKEG
jgi:hypothetical protein